MSSTSYYRLREFINPVDQHSLIVDASGGLSLGPLPGLEHFSAAVSPILSLVDGLIVSPGQARKLTGHTLRDAALLVRADWTNASRGPGFVLPPETIRYVPLLAPEDALDLGASALAQSFLLGHEEEIEAGCLRLAVQAAIEGGRISMPLLVDVSPIGPRIVLYRKAIELGVSYALESGADGVAIPWPGGESFETILRMAAGTPIWIKPSSLGQAGEELASALQLGGTGLWLAEEIFSRPNVGELLDVFRLQIHPIALREQR